MIFTLLSCASLAYAAVLPRAGVKVLIGNDDGWATANVRTLFNTLQGAGFDTILSCPAENKSGSSSLEFPPVPLITEGQFGTIPIGSPATGCDPSNPRICYANSFPVTALKFGLDTVAKDIFGGKPELVVTGPNVGGNLGLITQFSGTVGAATEAMKQGIPAIAFSGAGGTQHSFENDDPVARVYGELALKVIQTIVDSGKPYLPQEVALNVNFPVSDANTCTSASDFKFVMSRVNFDINPFTDDVEQCGSNHLPTESEVIDSGNCRVSISAFGKGPLNKFDVSKDKQTVVHGKLQSILSCLD